MPVFFLYILKLSCSLAVIWLFYRLLLRGLTFYDLNRWYLLGYSLLAFLIPLIDISPALQTDRPDESLVLRFIPPLGEYTPALAHTPAGRAAYGSLWMVASGILLFGALLLLVRVVIRWLVLRQLRRTATLIRGGKWKIYQVDEAIRPFSFGKAIYINRDLHTEKEWEEIILHEYGHVRGRHTVDILFAEWLTVLNWYNPFAWLIRHSIRQNLEFIADRQVLAGGFDRKGYQYHLLRVVGQSRYQLANNFNFSSLKKRIVMMNKLRSARLHLLKFLFILPLLGVLLVAFRDHSIGIRRMGEQPLRDIVTGSLRDTVTGSLRDTVPGSARDTLLARNYTRRRDSVRSVLWHEARRQDSIVKWKALGRDSLRRSGRDTVRITMDTLRDRNEVFNEKPHQELVHPWPPRPAPLFVVDGVETDASALQKMSPATIDSIRILKDSSAVARYGSKGRNGVVLIYLKNPAPAKP